MNYFALKSSKPLSDSHCLRRPEAPTRTYPLLKFLDLPLELYGIEPRILLNIVCLFSMC